MIRRKVSKRLVKPFNDFKPFKRLKIRNIYKSKPCILDIDNMSSKDCELCGEGVEEHFGPVKIMLCEDCRETIGLDRIEEESSWFIRNAHSSDFIGFAK